MALLEVDRLNVALAGRTVVCDLRMTLERGEILGLVGESGSGKSMTALALVGLLPRAASITGSVHFEGQLLSSLSPRSMDGIRGQGIGMVFQEPMTSLNPLMSIGAQVAETVRVHRAVSRTEAQAIARAALGRVGLDGARVSPDRFPHELSGGQRQRAAIAIAVVLSPKLLIADEPTTALDVSTQAEILRLLRQLVRDDGGSLLLISHDLGVVAQMADRVAVLRNGCLIDEGRTAELLQASPQAYTRALVAASSLQALRRHSTRTTSEPLLDVRDVVCEYGGARAVDGVSLAVMPGESVGVVGESGSGKSTLLRSILGVGAVVSGQIRLDGDAIAFARGAQLRRLRRMIQCVFQDPASSFDPRWRVQRLVAEPLHLLDEPLAPREQRRRVEDLLERVGLSAADANRFPQEFSGGQRQRIAIARALIVEPALIALDEAVSALDVTTRAQILSLLADLSDSMGLAYLFVSHDLSVIRAITDRVVVMENGRVVETGITREVFDSPRHPYTASLVAAAARL